MRPYTRLFKDQHDRALAAGGTSALAVYVALCRLHSDARPEEKNSFRAGKSRVARHSGCSTRQVVRVLPLLQAEGLIAISTGRRKLGQKENEENRVSLIGIENLSDRGGDSQSLGGDMQSLGGRDTQSPGGDRESEFFVPVIKKEKELKKKALAASGQNFSTPVGLPPSLLSVLAQANRIGLAHWKAEDWFNEMEACGWLDHQSRPVHNWRAFLNRVKAKWEADGCPSGPPASKFSLAATNNKPRAASCL